MAEALAELADGLRREQVRLLCSAMARAPVVNLVVVGFISYIVWDYVEAWALAAWTAAVLTSEGIRYVYARRTLATPPADAERGLAALAGIALFVGCARGSAMPLFFSSLPPAEHAALSVAFLGFCAGGLSTHGAYARAFYFFAAPMLIAMAVAWLLMGTDEGVVLSILFVVFALMVAMFAKDIEKLVHDSFVIRHERDRLVAQLERERKQVILERDRAEQADNAKSRFLAAASHDLRQPLHALSLFSATLSMKAATRETREIADSIGSAQRSLSVLVDALLDISKLDARAVSPELQPVHAGALAERIVAGFRPAAMRKGIDLGTTPCAAVVRTDPVLLERVLGNLLDNAIKYTRRGMVAVELQEQGERLRVSVKDTGEGIPAGERERVFEEFYQIGNPERDRTKGLGLGLAIVRRVCRLLGSEVELTSGLGRGSTFTFYLPLSGESPAVADRTTPTVDGQADFRDRDILVIDDEPDVRAAMRQLLEAWGCRVLTCGGLDEAGRLLDEHAGKVDLIVADFRLRAGESGIATVAALRRRLGPVPALLVTGDTAPERLREAQASGLPLLHKPVSGDALRQMMLASVAV